MSILNLTPEMVIPEWKLRSMERIAYLDQLEKENQELSKIFNQTKEEKEQEF